MIDLELEVVKISVLGKHPFESLFHKVIVLGGKKKQTKRKTHTRKQKKRRKK